MGVFVDWNGNVRSVEFPGDGLKCRVVQHTGFVGVDVLAEDGDGWCVIHEADYHESIDALNIVLKNN